MKTTSHSFSCQFRRGPALLAIRTGRTTQVCPIDVRAQFLAGNLPFCCTFNGYAVLSAWTAPLITVLPLSNLRLALRADELLKLLHRERAWLFEVFIQVHDVDYVAPATFGQ